MSCSRRGNRLKEKGSTVRKRIGTSILTAPCSTESAKADAGAANLAEREGGTDRSWGKDGLEKVPESDVVGTMSIDYRRALTKLSLSKKQNSRILKLHNRKRRVPQGIFGKTFTDKTVLFVTALFFCLKKGGFLCVHRRPQRKVQAHGSDFSA